MNKLIAALALALLAPSARAVDADWNAGLAPGMAMLQGATKDRFEDSAAIRGHVERKVPGLGGVENGWLGVELGYHLGHKIKNLPAILPETKIAFLQATPYVRAGVVRAETEFYGLLGAGYYRQMEKTITVSNGAQSVSATIQGKDHFGMNFGLGAQRWFDRVAVGVDLRYHNVFDDEQDIKAFVPSLRASYAF